MKTNKLSKFFIKVFSDDIREKDETSKRAYDAAYDQLDNALKELETRFFHDEVFLQHQQHQQHQQKQQHNNESGKT